MAQSHNQGDNGDTQMGEGDSDSGSLFELDPNEQNDSDDEEYDQNQEEAGLQNQQPSSQVQPSQQDPAQPLPDDPVPTYEGATYWRDALGLATPRSDLAAQRLPSYERVSNFAFYLNNEDSRILYEHVYTRNPDDFPAAPQPVLVQSRQNETAPGMQGPGRGGNSTRGRGQPPGRGSGGRGRGTTGRGLRFGNPPPQLRTQDLPNAELWTETVGSSGRPRFNAARNLASRQDRGLFSREFYLSAEDSHALRAIIRQNLSLQGVLPRGREQSTAATRSTSGRGNPPQSRTQDLPNAELWEDSGSFARTRYMAAQNNNLASLQDGSNNRFYLSAADSNILRDIIRPNQDAYPGPQPVVLNTQTGTPPTRGRGRGRGRPRGSRRAGRNAPRGSRGGQDQGRGGHSQPAGSVATEEQQELKTQDLPGAQFWMDDTRYTYCPLREYANNYLLESIQLVGTHGFWLNEQESQVLRAARLLEDNRELAQTGEPEYRREQPPYQGPSVHGTLEQYRWAIANNLPPDQFGMNYQGNWYGPTLDQINQEIANEREAPESVPQTELVIRSGKPRKPRDTNKQGRKDAPFDGLLEQNYEWWGSFIDDGPQQPGETNTNYGRRIKKARFNLQIERRAERPAPPPREPEQTDEERKKQTSDHVADMNRIIARHNHKMTTDEAYAAQWRYWKELRKSDNNTRRRQELAYVRQEYARRELPRFPTPEPPEDSGDDDEYFEKAKTKKTKDEGEDEEADDDDTGPNWDADPDALAKYRVDYPEREHMRCKNCLKRRKTCTFKEKPFPCDRCIADGVPCVRQSWKEGIAGQGAPRGAVGQKHFRGLQLYIPSLYVRQQLGDDAPLSWQIGDPDPPTRGTGTTAVPPNNPPRPDSAVLAASVAAAITVANAAAPTPANEPIIRCNRCVYHDFPCHKTRPCWFCIGAGVSESCDASIQNQQFGENAPDDGDDFLMYDNPDDFDGYDYSNIDLLPLGNQPFDDAAGNIFGSANTGDQPFVPFDPFGGEFGNIFESINAEGQNFAPPQVPGHQVAPGGPMPGPRPGQVHVPGQGWKRTADDDDDIFENLHMPKKQRGTTAENEALALLWAIEDSQINMYDPSGNSRPDTEEPLKYGDPFMFDNEVNEMADAAPSRSATPPPAMVPIYNSPAWTMTNLPTPSASSSGARQAWDDSKLCKENWDYWKRGPHNNCRKYPAKDCEEVTDNLQCSCNRCNREQDRMMGDQEADTFSASKLYCCALCEQKVITDIEGGVPNISREGCICRWQLNQTWICNHHREAAHQELKQTVARKMQDYIQANPGGGNEWSNTCPGCKLYFASVGSTWQCVACETYVYQDPLAA